MKDDVSIEELQKAVEQMHGAKARFVEAVDVREEHSGKVVWEGAVQVFDLAGHPKASPAYPWSVPTMGTKRCFVADLGLPPVDSSQMAVRASILADANAKGN